jgi:hypothetical protein
MSSKTLKSLLHQMDSIEGTTEGGRRFKVVWNIESDSFKTQIFSGDDEVYEPPLRMNDILKNNILSVINKIDESFFDKRMYMGSPVKTKRKNILIEGKQEENPFTINVRVENNWVGGNMQFRNSLNTLEMSRLVPDHIHVNQKHNWLYLHYQKQESWLDILKYNIKDKYYYCCKNNILGRYNYCFNCGKKQEVLGLEISNVVATELLTLLT